MTTEDVGQEAPRIVHPREELPFSPDDFAFDLEEVAFDDSSITDRHGAKSYPYGGCSVWLTPFAAPASMIEGATALQGGPAEQAVAIPLIRKGIAACVAGHNLVNPATGEFFPQFWRNPDALQDVPVETLFDLWSIVVNGELAATRGKGSSNGRAGTTTRASTGTRTGGTSAGRARR